MEITKSPYSDVFQVTDSQGNSKAAKAAQQEGARAMSENKLDMQKVYSLMQRLSHDELVDFLETITGIKKIKEVPEPFNKLTIDNAFLIIEMQRERLETMLSCVYPFFDKEEADEEEMTDIRCEYDKIRVYLDMMQEAINEIESQGKRWGRILQGIEQAEERKKAQQKEPLADNQVTLSWTTPPDSINLFDGYSRVHSYDKGERPQPASRSLEQIAWLIERMKEDDIFDGGCGCVDDDLERAVMEIGIILKHNSRPFLPADGAGDMLRELYEDWKQGRNYTPASGPDGEGGR